MIRNTSVPGTLKVAKNISRSPTFSVGLQFEGMGHNENLWS